MLVQDIHKGQKPAPQQHSLLFSLLEPQIMPTVTGHSQCISFYGRTLQACTPYRRKEACCNRAYMRRSGRQCGPAMYGSMSAPPVPLLAVGACEDGNAFQNQRVEVVAEAYVVCSCHRLPTQVLEGEHADTATCVPSCTVSFAGARL